MNSVIPAPKETPNGNRKRPVKVRSYKKGDFLFLEGQPAERAFALTEGRVKLSLCTRGGKVTVLRIAGPGDLIGLAAMIARVEHDTTAEVLENCRAEPIRRDVLFASFEKDPRAGLAIVSTLTQRCLAERQLIVSLVEADTVFVRLARLFLGWTENGNGRRPRLGNAFTHQQIAEIIGTSRETVTRAVTEMRVRELATFKGKLLFIHDRERLQLIIGSHRGL